MVEKIFREILGAADIGRLRHHIATMIEPSQQYHRAKDGQLVAYKHDGFWQNMDTLRDRETCDSCLLSPPGAVRWSWIEPGSVARIDAFVE